MLTRLWQNRYRGLLAALLIGLAGSIVVLLLPSRQNAVARVKIEAVDGIAIDAARAMNVLNDDRILSRVLQRVDPDIVDPIDPRPIDPLVAFRRHFNIAPSATPGEFDVAYAARSADTAQKVVQTWLRAAGEVIDRPNEGPQLSDVSSPRGQAVVDEGRAAVTRSPADAARLRDLEAQLVNFQPALDAARAALDAFDTRVARESAQAADNRRARRIRAAQRELDAAIAAVGASEAKLAATPQTIRQSGDAPASTPAARGSVDAQLQAKVQEAEAALAALRIRYTDSHPDVRRQMGVVADARAARDASRGTGAGGNRAAGPGAAAAGADRDVPNPALREVQREIAAAQHQVSNARAKLAEIEAEPAATDRATTRDSSPERIQLVATVTEIEQQIQRVTAERDELTRATTTPLATNATAGIVPTPPRNEVLRLKVLGGPEVSPAATNPDRPHWLWRVLAGSLALGVIAAFALSMRRTTYHDLRELDRGTRMRSLGAVPRFTTLTRRLAGLLRLLGFTLLLLFYVLAFIGLVAVVSAGLSWHDLNLDHLRQAMFDLSALVSERLGPMAQWLNVKGGVR